MEPHLNYYAILDLEPVLHDWPTIEKAILKKKREWSLHRNQGSPKQRREAEIYSEKIDEIKAFLSSKENVEIALQAFINQRKKAEQVEMERLDEFIDSMAQKTFTKAHVNKLRLFTKKHFTIAEIERRLIQKGLTAEEQTQTNTAKKLDRLEPSLEKEVNNLLLSVGAESIYDFLSTELGRSYDVKRACKSLYEGSNAAYKQLIAKGQVDSIHTNKMQLAGHAKSIFSSDASKARYDNTWSFKNTELLKEHVELAGLNGFIDSKALNKLISRAKELKIDPSIAMHYIEQIATKRKWVLINDDQTELVHFLQCGFCSAVAKSIKDKHCHSCGEELVQPCPKCGTPTPTENAVCRECGCHVGDAPLVKGLYNQSKKCMDNGDYHTAFKLIQSALQLWPDWQTAQQEKKLLENEINKQATLDNELLSLIREKKLQAANQKLQSSVYQKYVSEQLKLKVQHGLNNAALQCDRANKLARQGQIEQAYAEYEAVLAMCADHEQANAALLNSPPPNVTALDATLRNTKLKLTWHKVAAKGRIIYRIVRKQASAPNHPNDGVTVGEVSSNCFEDTRLTVGERYYYAIYSVRGGACALKSAVTGPLMLIGDVVNLQEQVGDNQVVLSWQRPNGCHSVVVWRQPHSHKKMTLGQGVILSEQGDSLLDSDVENGQSYDYLVAARFIDPNNPKKFTYSDGKCLTVKPAKMPDPIMDLVATKSERKIILNWTDNLPVGHVEIRQCRQKPPFCAGERLSVSDVQQCGKLIPTSSKGYAQTDSDVQGQFYYVPLSVNGQVINCGKPVKVTNLDDVSQLHSHQLGRSIILQWQWPKGATQVLLSYRHDQFPMHSADPIAAKIWVTKAEYEQQDKYLLRSAESKKYFFKIFVCDPQAGIYSDGISLLETMGQENIVRYYVQSEKKLIRRGLNAAWIKLKYQAGKSLHDVSVVLKPKHPPNSKSDGINIHQVKLIRFEDDEALIEIPQKYLDRSGYIKLFFSNDEDAKETRLLPPAKEKLRIN